MVVTKTAPHKLLENGTYYCPVLVKNFGANPTPVANGTKFCKCGKKVKGS